MTWREAIERLEEQVRAWAPHEVNVESQEWSEDPQVNVLVFARHDPRGERRVTLAPAVWKRDQVPTEADLYSSRGPRVRLQGPDDKGQWRVLTNDLIPMKVSWNETEVGDILNVLLAA